MSQSFSPVSTLPPKSIDLNGSATLAPRATVEGLFVGIFTGALCLVLVPWVEVSLLIAAISGLLAGLRAFGKANLSDASLIAQPIGAPSSTR